ncbi:MAG: hypothetical protein AAFX65_01780 [Cyanobacteria bacterium J06638_7]
MKQPAPPGALALRWVALCLRRRPGPLRPQISAALGAHGEPLRWAVTAVRGDHLCLEAVVLIGLPPP